MRLDPVAIVDAAMKAGKFGPERRDCWLVEVAAGGRRGAQAVSELLAMAPADAATRRRWQQAAAKGTGKAKDAEPDQDALYELLYPDNPAAAAEVEKLAREQAREAVRFREAQNHDNELLMPEAAARGIEGRRSARARAGDPAAAATDEELFTRLFGRPT
jgi:hypothetical protein